MKYIYIDTNCIIRHNDEIHISGVQAKFFGLKNGMKIYAYMEEDVWDAVVHKYISEEGYESWFVELNDLRETLCDEQVKWNSVSVLNGMCIGEEMKEKEIVQRLINLNYKLDEIDRIVGLSDDLKKRLSQRDS